VASVVTEVQGHWSSEQWLYRRLWPRVVAMTRARDVGPVMALRGVRTDQADLVSLPADPRQTTVDILTAVSTHVLEKRRSTDPASGVYSGQSGFVPARLDPDAGPAARGGVVRLAFHWTVGLLLREQTLKAVRPALEI
jgi:hypothetical protein